MNQNLLTLTFALCIAGSTALAAEPKRIYLANDDHTDFIKDFLRHAFAQGPVG